MAILAIRKQQQLREAKNHKLKGPISQGLGLASIPVLQPHRFHGEPTRAGLGWDLGIPFLHLLPQLSL